MVTQAIPGFDGELFCRNEEDLTFDKVAEVRTITLLLEMQLSDVTTYGDEGFRAWDQGLKGWSVQADWLYLDPKPEVHKKFFDSMIQGKSLFIKVTPNPAFDTVTLQRRIFGGLVEIVNWETSAPNADSAFTGVVMVGRGPIEKRGETQAQDDIICSCIEWYQTIYLSLNQSYQPPPAPAFSTGWQVDWSFYTSTTGTGNIPLITVNAAFIGETLLQNTLDGCPIPVTIKYLCDFGNIVPSGAGTLRDDWIEVVNKTQNPGQLELIKIAETQTGVDLLPDKSNAGALYDAFNTTFLVANPTFVLDMSGIRLSDLSFINTLAALKKLNVSNNNITGDNLDELTDVNLNLIDLSFNFLGSDHGKKLLPMINTLKSIDLSHNQLTEAFLLGEGGIGSPNTIDFYDISFNFIASMSNEQEKVKEFNVINNIFPDAFAFWVNNTFREANEIAIPARASEDRSVAVLYNFSGSDLVDPHSTTIQTLIDNIAVAKGISSSEAEKFVKYDPDFDNIVPPKFNPTRLYADESRTEDFNGF